MKAISAVSILAAAFFASCGGGSDLPVDSSVQVTLSPLTASIPTGGTVALQAQVSGFTAAPFLDWWMQEQHNAGINGSENCDDIKPINQDLIPGCKFGYIVINSMDQNASTATYYAPATPGTYHVTFRASQSSSIPLGGFVEKDVTATISVHY